MTIIFIAILTSCASSKQAKEAVKWEKTLVHDTLYQVHNDSTLTTILIKDTICIDTTTNGALKIIRTTWQQRRKSGNSTLQKNSSKSAETKVKSTKKSKWDNYKGKVKSKPQGAQLGLYGAIFLAGFLAALTIKKAIKSFLYK